MKPAKTKPAKKSTAAPAPAQPETPKSRLLQLRQPEGVSMDKVVTDMVAAGIAPNAAVAVDFSRPLQGEVSLTDMVNSLQESGKAVNGNNFTGPEQMLNAQAVALNAIFAEMSRRAALNMGQYPEATERYLRLAMKAQSQCRTTLETLAAIKNPPVVYAKQANIAHGPQQVNNGTTPSNATSTHMHAQAHGEREIPPTKLLEGETHGCTVLDARATREAAPSHSAMEAVGAIHRPQESGREGNR